MSKELIKKKFSSLPESTQQAILDIDLPEKIREIGQKSDLHFDKLKKLENETMLTLLGINSRYDFADQLKKELNIKKEKAEKLTKIIDEKIFDSIRSTVRENITETEKEDKLKKNTDSRSTESKHSISRSKDYREKTKDDPYLEPIE